MQFLKILFWCLLAFVAAVFTVGNWTWVNVALPGGLVAQVNLPFLLLLTFLLGYLPTHVYHLLRRWRLRQRLAARERQLDDARAVALAPAPLAPVALAESAPPAPEPVVAAVPTHEPPPGALL